MKGELIARRSLMITLGVAAVLMIARSAVFMRWEQANFDSDQAVLGLMAKHLAEGRAFPMFYYGQPYQLAVEAWLAAPMFALFGPSVAVLKIPALLLNLATGGVLIWILHRDGGLRPWIVFLVSLFFVAAAPGMAASLTATGGGNPEPFLYVLLLWLLRDRPLVFGMVFGIGFLNREFTAYGLIAIVALSLMASPRMTRERWRHAVLVAVGYFIVVQLVHVVFLYSTPSGPGSTITGPLGTGANVEGLLGRWCWSPRDIGSGLVSLFGDYLSRAYGADASHLADFGVRSSIRAGLPNLPPFWPVLGTTLALAMARVVWLSVRRRAPIWRGHGSVATFLFLVGLQAAVVYMLSRCSSVQITTFRYALLSLYLGIGIVALFFVYERNRVWRSAVALVLLVWFALSVGSHVRLLREYLYEEPTHPRRALVDYLIANDIRYARADYWTAYYTTFLAQERVIVASTNTIRIDAYQREVAAHQARAVSIFSAPCDRPGGTEVVSGNFWICPE